MKNKRRSTRCLVQSIGIILISMMTLSSCSDEPVDSNAAEVENLLVPREPAKEVTIHPVDGGPDYYGRFSSSLSTDPDYFPIGVWFESLQEPSDREKDRSLLINTYVELVPGFDLALLGKDAFALSSDKLTKPNGFVLPDEVDMWAGPGWGRPKDVAPGSGDTCVVAGERCGFTILTEVADEFPPAALLYANFGKGVTFWNKNDESAMFVNKFADVVSADNYWFTDPNICSKMEGGQILSEPRDLNIDECRNAANYGWTVARLRELVQPLRSRPVWAFIEVGHPFSSENSPTIAVKEIRAAVWSSLINNARGIVYFNHSFAGPCASQHVLRDCGDDLREGVKSLNSQIIDLAPVLNSDYLEGATVTDGEVETSTRIYKNRLYLFAGSKGDFDQIVEFSVKCAENGNVKVIDENRSIKIVDGKFRDEFSGKNEVHLYELGNNTCTF